MQPGNNNLFIAAVLGALIIFVMLNVGGHLSLAPTGVGVSGPIALNYKNLDREYIQLTQSTENIAHIEFVKNTPIDVVKNGSFESGPYPEGMFLTLPEASQDLVGWTVTRATIDYLRMNDCTVGVRCIDLNGTPGYGEIKQVLKTEPGKTYRLTLDMAGNTRGDPIIKQVEVSADGQSTVFRHSRNHYWTEKSFVFTASGAATTLALKSLDTEGEQYGALIDNIRVLPETKPEDWFPAEMMITYNDGHTETVGISQLPEEILSLEFGVHD